MAQPDLIPSPFAENATPGTIEPIPPLTPTVPQQATWSTGFPQVTMQPLAAGGIPPRGQDFNAALNSLSQHIYHTQGGGQYKWDAAHGPYSIGDVLQSDDGLRSYVSVVDNNTTNFNTTPGSIGVSWMPWSGGAASELVAGLIQLATSAETQTGTISTKAVTPSALSSRTSTESRTGLIQLATAAEARALTNDTKSLTPKKLADAFTGMNQNLSNSGYQRIPGGLIIQWGAINGLNSANINATYPVAFNALGLPFLCTIEESNSRYFFGQITARTNVGFSGALYSNANGTAPVGGTGGEAVDITWGAIGY